MEKMEYLRDVVLPRRVAFLSEVLEDEEMPFGIKKMFVRKEVQLIVSVRNDIKLLMRIFQRRRAKGGKRWRVSN
jgi:hypothetical protein